MVVIRWFKVSPEKKGLRYRTRYFTDSGTFQTSKFMPWRLETVIGKNLSLQKYHEKPP